MSNGSEDMGYAHVNFDSVLSTDGRSFLVTAERKVAEAGAPPSGS